MDDQGNTFRFQYSDPNAILDPQWMSFYGKVAVELGADLEYDPATCTLSVHTNRDATTTAHCVAAQAHAHFLDAVAFTPL